MVICIICKFVLLIRKHLVSECETREIQIRNEKIPMKIPVRLLRKAVKLLIIADDMKMQNFAVLGHL